MKHLNWHPESHETGHLKSGWAIGVGVLLGLAILLWILDPFGADKSSVPDYDRGFTLLQDPENEDTLNLDQASEWLLDAIIQIESQGDPEMVGGVGERGLMQIRESTWDEVTRKHFKQEISFERAFEPELNRQVGRYYLGDLQIFLYANRDKWQSDLRSLLLACYNAGPTRVRKSGFNLRRLPSSVQSYARRGSALHDWYLKNDAEKLQILLNEAADPVDQE